MRELSNPGASGSIFYLTIDDQFILKTVQLKEAEFLTKLLPGYYMVGRRARVNIGRSSTSRAAVSVSPREISGPARPFFVQIIGHELTKP
jgi:hypothetical protein